MVRGGAIGPSLDIIDELVYLLSLLNEDDDISILLPMGCCWILLILFNGDNGFGGCDCCDKDGLSDLRWVGLLDIGGFGGGFALFVLLGKDVDADGMILFLLLLFS